MELPPDFPHDLSLGMADSPLNVDNIMPWLLRYPDRGAAQFLREGLLNGFSLNADLGLAHVHFDNLASARNRPDVVLPLLAKEIRAGRLSGPHPEAPFSMRVSPIGVVKKSQDDSLATLLAHDAIGMPLDRASDLLCQMEEDLVSTQEWRLVFDLSAHDRWGRSVNSTTPDEFKNVQYTSFDSVVEKVSLLSDGAMCAKSDVKSAFRLLKLASDFFCLTGMQYGGWFYFDRCMPFGASTAPLTWEVLATFLNWVVIQVSGDPGLEHMADDYIAFAENEDAVNNQMSVFHSVSRDFGVPINYAKYVAATPRICFLGLIIDMILRMVIAPQIKILRAWRAVNKLLSRGRPTVHLVQSTQGRLSFLCRAVPPGRAFLSRGYRLIAGKEQSERVVLPRGYICDLRAWKKFLESFNGQVFFRDYVPDPTLGWYTDSSTSWGTGSWIKMAGQYFALQWPARVLGAPESTTLLELCPIVISLNQPMWEGLFRNKSLQVFCDNESCCEIVNKRSSAVPKIAKWVRWMMLRCMQLNCTITAVWVPTTDMPSDPLSRNNIPLFLSQVGGDQKRITPRLSTLPSLSTLGKSHRKPGQRLRGGRK